MPTRPIESMRPTRLTWTDANEANANETVPDRLLMTPLPLPCTPSQNFSAIVAEMKGYFGILISNNQLGRWNSCSLRSQNGTCCIENVFLS